MSNYEAQIAAALAVTDAFMTAFNARDLPAFEQTFRRLEAGAGHVGDPALAAAAPGGLVDDQIEGRRGLGAAGHQQQGRRRQQQAPPIGGRVRRAHLLNTVLKSVSRKA